jgi:glyceraldehyde 3-phosphate dehydrogenase
MSKVAVAINGFGEMGRQVFRTMKDLELKQNPFGLDLEIPEIEVVAVNDLASTENLAYLFKHHSLSGWYPGTVDVKGDVLTVDGHDVKVFHEPDPANIDWGGVDVVYDVSGVKDIIENPDALSEHLRTAGAVLIGNPSSVAEKTLVYGINHEEYAGEQVVSGASCTTNCLAPVAYVILKEIGDFHGKFNTVHAYTGNQRILDGPHKSFERGLAGALNIIPTTTGAHVAIGKIMPELANKIYGFSMRVPVGSGSVVDLTFSTKRWFNPKQLNDALVHASETYLRGILGVTGDKMSSSRAVSCPLPSLVSLVDSATVDMGTEGTLGSVVSWYDNQRGYTLQAMRLIEHIGNY